MDKLYSTPSEFGDARIALSRWENEGGAGPGHLQPEPHHAETPFANAQTSLSAVRSVNPISNDAAARHVYGSQDII